MTCPDATNPKPTPFDWFMRGLAFLVIALGAFFTPGLPVLELDASWRMVLGHAYLHGAQFGTETIFTYGPLGFILGNTYWGGQWASLIFWQALIAVCSAALVCWHIFQLKGYARAWALAFFLVWGFSYPDGAQQILIALAGLTLIRRGGEPWSWSNLALLALLVLLSLIKFTNLLLAFTLVVLAGGLDYWLRQKLHALRLPALFAGLFILGWLACGQHLFNLPAYFIHSWQISQGYQDAMGLAATPAQLRTGLLVLTLFVAYSATTFFTAEDRRKAAGLCLGGGAFVFLNWKHGFIRADGHQIGFYYVILTLVVLAHLLFAHNNRLRPLKLGLLALLALGAAWGNELILPRLMREGLSAAQTKLNLNISFLLHLGENHARYDERLRAQGTRTDLVRTKSIVKDARIDMLGYEQAALLFNGFNYAPRPIFQDYSAYTPTLAQLNFDYFASDRAPDFVLFKLHALDGRLGAMFDPAVLRLLPYRYHYVATDLGYTLWQKDPGAFDPATIAPRPVRATTLKLDQNYSVADLEAENVWAVIDYDFSLLGKLRRFLLRPPEVKLRIVDTRGETHLYRLPEPIGRGGFILSPVINDTLDFMRANGDIPRARATSIAITVDPADRKFVADEISVQLFTLPPSTAAKSYFSETNSNLFHMFANAPASYKSFLPPNEDFIDDHRVMVMHAPSSMYFDVPPGASEITGQFGFVPGAYTNGGKTNGAIFTVIGSSGPDSRVLFERTLDPATRPNDRGLQSFKALLPNGTDKVELRIGPGQYNINAFDWTAWNGIEFK